MRSGNLYFPVKTGSRTGSLGCVYWYPVGDNDVNAMYLQCLYSPAIYLCHHGNSTAIPLPLWNLSVMQSWTKMAGYLCLITWLLMTASNNIMLKSHHNMPLPWAILLLPGDCSALPWIFALLFSWAWLAGVLPTAPYNQILLIRVLCVSLAIYYIMRVYETCKSNLGMTLAVKLMHDIMVSIKADFQVFLYRSKPKH